MSAAFTYRQKMDTSCVHTHTHTQPAIASSYFVIYHKSRKFDWTDIGDFKIFAFDDINLTIV